MGKARILSRGLLIVGLVAALCTCGLAAQGSAPQNQGAAAGQGQATAQPRASQPGSTPQATAPGSRTPSSQMAPAGQGMMLAKASELIGKDIKNPQGESLGVIHDIVLSQDYQQVSYVALSSGGAFGMGRTLYAIPWQALKVGPNGQVTLSATKDQFTQTSGFSNDNWPSQGNPQWLRAGGAGQAAMSQGQTSAGQGQAAAGQNQTGTSQSQVAAGQTRISANQNQAAAGRSQTDANQATAGRNQAAAGQNQAAAGRNQAAATAPGAGQSSSSMGAAGQPSMANQAVQMRRVTHLIGMAVRNSQSQDLGDIEDFAISASDGRVIYDIVAFGGVAGIGEKLAAVPAAAVRFQPQTHTAMLNATPKTLESAVFKAGDLASLSSPDQMQRLSKLFPPASGSALGYVPSQEPSPQMQLIADQKTWGADSQISKSFNPSNVKTIKGTVENVGTFQPEGAAAGASTGLRLRVKTSDGNLVTVYAGPSSYAEKNNFFVKPGDEITITGSESKMGTRSVIVASQLAKGSQTLQLRDQSGKPLWTTGGQSSSSMSTTPGTAPGSSQKSGAANQGAAGQSTNRTRPQ